MVFKRKRNRHKLFEENNFTDLGYSSSIWQSNTRENIWAYSEDKWKWSNRAL